MGLSLTPPTPESLPVVATDHENFHNMLLPQEGGARQQPVANGPGGVVTDVEVAGDLSGTGMQNGSLEGLEAELFRPRSAHVAGSHLLDHRPLVDVGGSSHEQLHYGASVETGGGDLQKQEQVCLWGLDNCSTDTVMMFKCSCKSLG